jgi:hypothetical protein
MTMSTRQHEPTRSMTAAQGRRASRPRRLGAARLGFVLVSAVLGASLLVLAVPRTLAAWASLDAVPAIDKLQMGQTPSADELTNGVTALKRALDWTPSARRLADLALLELEQAFRFPKEDSRRAELLGVAEQHLVAGLRMNPANGFAWLRLATVRELQGAPARQVAVALTQSLDVAPNMRKLWIPRAAGLLAYWRYLTVDELQALRGHLRAIWTADKTMRLPLMRAAQQVEQFPILAWSLTEDPIALEELERLKPQLAQPIR